MTKLSTLCLLVAIAFLFNSLSFASIEQIHETNIYASIASFTTYCGFFLLYSIYKIIETMEE